jgi:hypothetical protein
MWKNKGPFRLVLNGAASKEIEWHCKHYVGRGLMKRFESGAALALEFGVPLNKLEETFNKYNEVAKNGKCPFGKKVFLGADDLLIHLLVLPQCAFQSQRYLSCCHCHTCPTFYHGKVYYFVESHNDSIYSLF